MHKKLITACLAIAAFAAFAVTSAASASPVVTENGVAVATGSKITGTLEQGTVAKFTSAAGTIECDRASLTGTLTSNTGTHISGDIESAKIFSAAHGEDCNSFAGTMKATPTISAAEPWCITSTKGTDNFTVRGGSCAGEAKPIKFTLDFTTPGWICGYERAAATPVEGTFTTNVTPATVKFEKQVFTLVHNNSPFCPSKGELDMAFSLYTDNAEETPLTIS